jgi:hypothetical protein
VGKKSLIATNRAYEHGEDQGFDESAGDVLQNHIRYDAVKIDPGINAQKDHPCEIAAHDANKIKKSGQKWKTDD